MDWRKTQAEYRSQFLAKVDVAEVERYHSLVGQLSDEDEQAYLSDLSRVFSFREGMAVLDVGSGTGGMCQLLLRIGGLAVTALEPAPAMLAKLKSKPGLKSIHTVEGFCDGPNDRPCFNEAQFDVIVSRQLSNGLFDPLAAFRNWLYWLSPGGAVVMIDGLYGRSAWTGQWEEEIDLLPLSACQTMALTPYLLETAGFHIDTVARMESTNRLPSTRTPRYVVVARKC